MHYGELEKLLIGRIEEVCQLLIPQGKKSGNKWVFGDLDGSSGKSGSVNLSGSHIGSWADWAVGGDQKNRTLISLWCKVRCNGDFRQTCKEVKEYLNIKDSNPFGKKIEKSYLRPTKAEMSTAKEVDQTSKVMKYLEDRGISQSTLDLLKIRQNKEDTGYIFPYYDDSGVVMLKTVLLERQDGKKKMWATKDAKSVLFGKPAIKPSEKTIVITEGELDAASWIQCGIPAVSVPQGANNENWIENDWEWLDCFETIYLNFDSDEAGQSGAKSAARRLGYERVKNIVFDSFKDANEMLTSGEEYPERFLNEAKDLRPPEIQSFFDDWDSHVAEYEQYEKNPPGIVSPWPTLKWRIRKKEVTAVSGYTSHGKTAAMTQLICHLQSYGWNGLIASLEMETGATKSNTSACLLGQQLLTSDDRMRIKNHPSLRDMLLVVQESGRSMKAKTILENFKLCVNRYGIDYFVLDNMMMCEVGVDDYDSQRDFVIKLQDIAIQTNTHVFIVSHPRKPPSPKELEAPPSIYEMKGASEIANLTNNFMSVWRNVKKHKRLAELKEEAQNGSQNWQEQTDLAEKHDGVISISKQRGGYGEEQGWQGDARVWMKSGKQFVCSLSGKSTNYLNEYDLRVASGDL